MVELDQGHHNPMRLGLQFSVPNSSFLVPRLSSIAAGANKNEE
jgi:hypothetical protein